MTRSRRARRDFLSFTGAMTITVAVSAQDAPPTGQSPSDEDVVVTARRQPGTAIGATAPIAVLDIEAIRALAASNMKELLERLKPLTTSANGGSPVILLNGRRISGFGEVETLPPEAMERSEILSEQDAARFGFPATVRVLNLVTKKKFRAISVQELAGTTTEGGGATQYAEATSTRIDGSRRTSLTVSHFQQNQVLQSQRGIVPDPDGLFAIDGNLTGVGGGSIDPALDALAGRAVRVAAIPADPASLANYLATADVPAITDPGRYRTIQPRTETWRADGTFAAPIGKALSGSINVSAESQQTSGLNGLAPALLRVPGENAALPFTSDVLLYRAIPDTVLRQNGDTLTLHAAGTVQGSIRRWAWNVTTSYDRVRATASSQQGVPLAALQSAIDAGADPFASLAPDIAAQRIVDVSRTVTGTVTGKAVANGPLLRLPAGEALVTLSADVARSASEGRQPGLADSSLSLARTTRGASINADVPIASADRDVLGFVGQLAINGMIGVSDVSDYGRLVNSNYGVTWGPARPIQVSASINEVRAAPAIALLTGPTLSYPNVPFFDFTTGTSALVTTLVGGNPALAPERRRVTTVGVALKPFKDREFHANLEYLDTRIVNQTATLGSATPAFQAAFPDLFVRDASGQLIRADLRPVNIARERERKLRMTINLFTQIGPAPPPPTTTPGVPAKDAPPPPPPKPRPTVYAFATTTWRLDNDLLLRPGSAPLDLLDGATLTGTGGRPRWEVEGNLGGSIGATSAGVYARFQGATRVRGDLPASDLRFSGRSWLVLYGMFDAEKVVQRPWARKLTLNLTFENLLNDRIDVRDGVGATPNRFQSAYLDPIGRSIRLGVRKLF